MIEMKIEIMVVGLSMKSLVVALYNLLVRACMWTRHKKRFG